MSELSRSLRLGFAGTPEFSVPALDALHATRHTLAAVFTQPDRPAGRGRSLQASAVKRRALELGIDVHQPPSFKTPDALELLRSLELDVLIVVAYGLILPTAVLAAPRLGCFNIHASLLPRWRGAAPIQRALLAGDAVTGVTIMRMEAGLDTGPMLIVRETPIGPAENAGTVHDRLAALGGPLMCEALEEIVAGLAVETPQPAAGVTYADKISKSEALIDWREDAARILRKVQAFNPWPVAQTSYDGTQLRIWKAAAMADRAPSAAPGTVLDASGVGIDIACGKGVLRVLELQLAGRKTLAAVEFLKSQQFLNTRLGVSCTAQ